MGEDQQILDRLFHWPLDWWYVLGLVIIAATGLGWWYMKKKIEWAHESTEAKNEERQKTIKEHRAAALAACKELQAIVGEWENAVGAAVKFGETAPDTCDKLVNSITENKFNIRLAQQLPFVAQKAVPECGNVALLACHFALTALQKKTQFLGQLGGLDDPLVAAQVNEHNRRAVAETLRALRDQGVGLAIEDTLVDVVSAPDEPGAAPKAGEPFDLRKNYESRKKIALSRLLDLGSNLRVELAKAMNRLR